MKPTLVAVAVLLSGCAAAPSQPAPDAGPNARLMIVGRWANAEPGSKCVEQFDFRADGTVYYASDGGARIEGSYTLSPNPSVRGLRVLVMNVSAFNGGKDCLGEIPGAEIGGTSVSYVWLDATKEILLGCAEDSYSYCDIPLRRLR